MGAVVSFTRRAALGGDHASLTPLLGRSSKELAKPGRRSGCSHAQYALERPSRQSRVIPPVRTARTGDLHLLRRGACWRGVTSWVVPSASLSPATGLVVSCVAARSFMRRTRAPRMPTTNAAAMMMAAVLDFMSIHSILNCS